MKYQVIGKKTEEDVVHFYVSWEPRQKQRKKNGKTFVGNETRLALKEENTTKHW